MPEKPPDGFQWYQLIWAKFENHPWWPGILLDKSVWGLQWPSLKHRVHDDNKVLVYWLGTVNVSMVLNKKILDYANNYFSVYDERRPGKEYHRAVAQANSLVFSIIGQDVSGRSFKWIDHEMRCNRFNNVEEIDDIHLQMFRHLKSEKNKLFFFETLEDTNSESFLWRSTFVKTRYYSSSLKYRKISICQDRFSDTDISKMIALPGLDAMIKLERLFRKSPKAASPVVNTVKEKKSTCSSVVTETSTSEQLDDSFDRFGSTGGRCDSVDRQSMDTVCAGSSNGSPSLNVEFTTRKERICPECRKVYYCVSALYVHRMSAHFGWRCRCNTCEQLLITEGSVKTHIRQNHPEAVGKENSWSHIRLEEYADASWADYRRSLQQKRKAAGANEGSSACGPSRRLKTHRCSACLNSFESEEELTEHMWISSVCQRSMFVDLPLQSIDQETMIRDWIESDIRERRVDDVVDYVVGGGGSLEIVDVRRESTTSIATKVNVETMSGFVQQMECKISRKILDKLFGGTDNVENYEIKLKGSDQEIIRPYEELVDEDSKSPLLYSSNNNIWTGQAMNEFNLESPPITSSSVSSPFCSTVFNLDDMDLNIGDEYANRLFAA